MSTQSGSFQSSITILIDTLFTNSRLVCKALIPNVLCLSVARTNKLSPSEIKQRKTSLRKNDRLLHIDAFPSRPSHGQRILRLFCNINPNGEERVWHIGECFVHLAPRYLAKLMLPFPGSRSLWVLQRVYVARMIILCFKFMMP